MAAKKFKVDESNVRMCRKQFTSPIRLMQIKKKKRQNERPEHLDKIEKKLMEWLYDLRAKKQAIAFKDLREMDCQFNNNVHINCLKLQMVGLLDLKKDINSQ